MPKCSRAEKSACRETRANLLPSCPPPPRGPDSRGSDSLDLGRAFPRPMLESVIRALSVPLRRPGISMPVCLATEKSSSLLDGLKERARHDSSQKFAGHPTFAMATPVGHHLEFCFEKASYVLPPVPKLSKGIKSACISHRAWRGFPFQDLIRPRFLFLGGVSPLFSLGRIIAFQIAAGILEAVQQKPQERGGFVAFGEMAR